MEKYHLSVPLFLDDSHVKILCNHILLEIFNLGTDAQRIRNLDLFQADERHEIINQVIEKINSMPEETRRQYNKKSK